MAQLVKNLPAMQETWVRSLGWEGPLEKGKAPHSCILAWRIPWTEEPGGATVHGVAKNWTRLRDTFIRHSIVYMLLFIDYGLIQDNILKHL